MKSIVIPGAGTGGSMMANRLRRALPARSWNIVAVDRDDDHLYQPGLLFVPFGESRLPDLVRSRKGLFDPGIELVLGELAHIDTVARRVMMADGAILHYDILVVATGCRLAPEGTEGLVERGWRESASDFYTPEGARWLAGALDR